MVLSSRCNAATDLIFRQRFEPPVPACGRGFPSLSKEGPQIPISPTEGLERLGILARDR